MDNNSNNKQEQYNYNESTAQEVHVPIFVQAQAVDDTSSAAASNTSKSATHASIPTAFTTTTTTRVTHIPSPITPPDLQEMKRHRVRSQCLGGWVGGAVGLLLLSIPGAIIGAIAGNKLTKHHLKKEETRAQREYEYRLASLQGTNTNANVVESCS